MLTALSSSSLSRPSPSQFRLGSSPTKRPIRELTSGRETNISEVELEDELAGEENFALHQAKRARLSVPPRKQMFENRSSGLELERSSELPQSSQHIAEMPKLSSQLRTDHTTPLSTTPHNDLPDSSPPEVPACLHPPSSPPADKTEVARRQNDLRFKSRLESIFEKYSRDFTDVGDEIDLVTGEIVVDNGHLANMTHARDTGLDDGLQEESTDNEDENVQGFLASVLAPVTEGKLESPSVIKRGSVTNSADDDWQTDGSNKDGSDHTTISDEKNRIAAPALPAAKAKLLDQVSTILAALRLSGLQDGVANEVLHSAIRALSPTSSSSPALNSLKSWSRSTSMLTERKEWNTWGGQFVQASNVSQTSQREPQRTSFAKQFTPAEDKLLSYLRDALKLDWDEVASKFPLRPRRALQKRYHIISKSKKIELQMACQGSDLSGSCDNDTIEDRLAENRSGFQRMGECEGNQTSSKMILTIQLPTRRPNYGGETETLTEQSEVTHSAPSQQSHPDDEIDEKPPGEIGDRLPELQDDLVELCESGDVAGLSHEDKISSISNGERRSSPNPTSGSPIRSVEERQSVVLPLPEEHPMSGELTHTTQLATMNVTAVLDPLQQPMHSEISSTEEHTLVQEGESSSPKTQSLNSSVLPLPSAAPATTPFSHSTSESTSPRPTDPSADFPSAIDFSRQLSPLPNSTSVQLSCASQTQDTASTLHLEAADPPLACRSFPLPEKHKPHLALPSDINDQIDAIFAEILNLTSSSNSIAAPPVLSSKRSLENGPSNPPPSSPPRLVPRCQSASKSPLKTPSKFFTCSGKPSSLSKPASRCSSAQLSSEVSIERLDRFAQTPSPIPSPPQSRIELEIACGKSQSCGLLEQHTVCLPGGQNDGEKTANSNWAFDGEGTPGFDSLDLPLASGGEDRICHSAVSLQKEPPEGESNCSPAKGRTTSSSLASVLSPLTRQALQRSRQNDYLLRRIPDTSASTSSPALKVSSRKGAVPIKHSANSKPDITQSTPPQPKGGLKRNSTKDSVPSSPVFFAPLSPSPPVRFFTSDDESLAASSSHLQSGKLGSKEKTKSASPITKRLPAWVIDPSKNAPPPATKRKKALPMKKAAKMADNEQHSSFEKGERNLTDRIETSGAVCAGKAAIKNPFDSDRTDFGSFLNEVIDLTQEQSDCDDSNQACNHLPISRSSNYKQAASGMKTCESYLRQPSGRSSSAVPRTVKNEMVSHQADFNLTAPQSYRSSTHGCRTSVDTSQAPKNSLSSLPLSSHTTPSRPTSCSSVQPKSSQTPQTPCSQPTLTAREKALSSMRKHMSALVIQQERKNGTVSSSPDLRHTRPGYSDRQKRQGGGEDSRKTLSNSPYADRQLSNSDLTSSAPTRGPFTSTRQHRNHPLEQGPPSVSRLSGPRTLSQLLGPIHQNSLTTRFRTSPFSSSPPPPHSETSNSVSLQALTSTSLAEATERADTNAHSEDGDDSVVTSFTTGQVTLGSNKVVRPTTKNWKHLMMSDEIDELGT